jgi:hypothetical protein
MSDYLTNLAARSLNQAPLLRPRLTPVFGAPAVTVAWRIPEAAGPENPPAHDSEQHPLQNRESTRRTSPQPELLRPAVPMVSASPSPSSLGSEPILTSAPGISPEPQLILAEQGKTNERLHVPAQTVEDKGPPAVRYGSNLTQSHLTPLPTGVTHGEPSNRALAAQNMRPSSPAAPTHTVATSTESAEHVSEAAQAPPHFAEVFASREEQPRETAIRPAHRVPAPEVPHRTVSVTATRKHVAVVSAIPPFIESPEPAPTIHVTIGRIEIRAIPATQPARPAAPARSAITLDEYLKNRSRGRP